jgi:restriction endonuclease Mrr
MRFVALGIAGTPQAAADSNKSHSPEKPKLGMLFLEVLARMGLGWRRQKHATDETAG